MNLGLSSMDFCCDAEMNSCCITQGIKIHTYEKTDEQNTIFHMHLNFRERPFRVGKKIIRPSNI